MELSFKTLSSLTNCLVKRHRFRLGSDATHYGENAHSDANKSDSASCKLPPTLCQTQGNIATGALANLRQSWLLASNEE